MVKKMKIPYELQDFICPYLNNLTSELSVTKAQLLHAAYTVGKRNYDDVYSNSYYSNREVEFRTSIVEAFLCENDAFLQRSPIYENLDPSEKGFINYFNGLTLSKLFCQQLFDFPWMMHLDVYLKGNDIIIGSEEGQSRPDLIGIDSSNDWLVMEAKGRTKRDNQAIQKAVEQSKKIRTINGLTPKLRLGSMIYSNQYNEIKMLIKDPPEHDEKFIDFDLDPSQFMYDYYSTIWNYMQQYNLIVEQIGNINFFNIGIPCTDITVGIESKIFKLLTKSYETNKYSGLFPDIKACIDSSNIKSFNSEFKNKGYFLGNDGVLIRADSVKQKQVRKENS